MPTTTVRKKLAVLWVLGVVMVVVMGFTLWFAYHSSQVANKALQGANKVSSEVPVMPVVNSYDTCKKAVGSKILQTAPAQCVTKSGQKFTDTTQAQQQYVTIKEWNVRAPYAGPLTLSYTISGNNAQFSAKQLDDLVAGTSVSCTGFAGIISRMSPNDLAYPDHQDTTTAAQAASTNSNFVHLGNYYYLFAQAQADCEGSLPSALSSKQTQLDTLVSQANDAVKALVTSLQVIN